MRSGLAQQGEQAQSAWTWDESRVNLPPPPVRFSLCGSSDIARGVLLDTRAYFRYSWSKHGPERGAERMRSDLAKTCVSSLRHSLRSQSCPRVAPVRGYDGSRELRSRSSIRTLLSSGRSRPDGWELVSFSTRLIGPTTPGVSAICDSRRVCMRWRERKNGDPAWRADTE